VKRYLAEIAACLLIVFALGMLAVWFARRRNADLSTVEACLRPVEVVGPAAASLWCGRDEAQLDAVTAQAGAPGCAGAVAEVLQGISSDTAQISVEATCRVAQVRDGFLSGKASLLLSIPLDLNLAGVADLAELPGIGQKTAVRIVEDRTANGLFCSIEELDRVKGIGEKTVERLGPMLQARCP